MAGETLTRLIAEKIPGQRFGVFFSTGEGRFFPNGEEESSGCVVTDRDDHYHYWTKWDHWAGRAAFDGWDSLPPQNDWYNDEEYRDARRAAGLADGLAEVE